MAQPTDTDSTANAQTPGSAAPAGSRTSAASALRGSSLLRRNPHMRKYLVAIVLVLIVGGYFAWRYFSSYETTDDAQIDGHLDPISARISGYVSKVNVVDNEYVKAGTVLVEIDPRDYQVAVDQARASLQDARAAAQALNINVPVARVNANSQISFAEANVEDAQAGITAAQQQSAAAKAQLAQAEANDAKAQSDLARYKQLVAKQEISEQMYDQAVAAAKASTAAVAASRASAAAATQSVAQARSRLAQAQASLRASRTGPQQVASTRARALAAAATVKQKEAALEQAELNLTYTKIVAPASGIVVRNVEVGMNVQPGQQLLSIAEVDNVWVTANFKETQLRYMRPGQRVEIHVDANGRDYKGRVNSISGTSGSRLSLLPPENATGNYVKVVQRIPVKIDLDPGQDKNHYLRLGMSVEPKVFIN